MWLLRGVSPGQTIAAAPAALWPRLFQALRHCGVTDPGLFHDRRHALAGSLQDGVADLQLTPRMCQFNFEFPPADVVEFFRMYYGPTQRAFAALDEAGQYALRKDLVQLWSENNQAKDGTTHVEGEYLEVIATKA